MPSVKDALETLYASAGATQTVTMRQFLGSYPDTAAAAIALSGSSDKKSKEYRAARRTLERYTRYIAGDRSTNVRNPDNATVKTTAKATDASRRRARERARREGIQVKRYKGKIKTSPRKSKRKGQDKGDENRTRRIGAVLIPPSMMSDELLNGDNGMFSEAFLDAYGAGAIGELYDIEQLDLEFGGADAGDEEEEGDEDE